MGDAFKNIGNLFGGSHAVNTEVQKPQEPDHKDEQKHEPKGSMSVRPIEVSKSSETPRRKYSKQAVNAHALRMKELFAKMRAKRNNP